MYLLNAVALQACGTLPPAGVDAPKYDPSIPDQAILLLPDKLVFYLWTFPEHVFLHDGTFHFLRPL